MFINSFDLNTSLWSKSYYHPYCRNGETEAQSGQVNNAIHTIRMEMNKSSWLHPRFSAWSEEHWKNFQSLTIKIKTPQSHVHIQERKPKAHTCEW